MHAALQPKSPRPGASGNRSATRTPLSKLTSALRQRGLRQGLAYVRLRAFEEWHERPLGIRTSGYSAPEDLGLGKHSRSYEPLNYECLRTALRSITVRPGRDVFLDYGAGMGRVVVAAARSPYRRVTGLELVPRLAKRAKANVRNAGAHLACPHVEILLGDAAKYEVPNDVTVVYLYNPFCGPVLTAVQETIRRSLLSAPRLLRLLYVCPRYVVNTFEDCPWLCRRTTLPAGPEPLLRTVLYEHRPGSGVRP